MADKKKYGKWSDDDLSLAVAAYKNGDHGLNKCAQIYNVPKPTLKRHALNQNVFANGDVRKFGRSSTFPPDIEDELVQHILKMEERFFGLTISDVRTLAFELAERNGILNNFNKEKRMAGKKWYYAFMKRHPNLSLRTPESTSVARIVGFCRERINKFFDLLEKVIDENKFTASTIFNMDESGFSTVQKKNQKVLAEKGKSQVGTTSSAERGTNTTMVCCISASGHYVPPMIIFKRTRWADELKRGVPPGSIVQISETGYINSDLFLVWLKHFINNVNCSLEKKVLLILDGHVTHTKNLAALEMAREHGVVMLSLPSHTTNRLQPLDVGFFGPLEKYYDQAVQKWHRTNPGCTISLFQVGELLGEAYPRAASIDTAINSYKKTGIWPVDRNVFKDCDFAASDALLEEVRNTTTASQGVNINASNSGPIDDEAAQDALLTEVSTSNDTNQTKNDTTATQATSLKQTTASKSKGAVKRSSTELTVGIEKILPLPKVTETESLRKRVQRSNTSEELTSSPYKNNLREKQQIRSAKQRKLNMNVEKTAEEPVKGSKKSVKKVTPVTPENNEDRAWYCKICKKCDKVDMIQCMKCHTWQHAVCANVSPLRKCYYCNDCKEFQKKKK